MKNDRIHWDKQNQDFYFHDMSLDPPLAVSDHKSNKVLSIVGINEYDTDDDERGVVNDEVEPLLAKTALSWNLKWRATVAGKAH